MKRHPAKSSRVARLPAKLRRFFWEYDFRELGWKEDKDLIISRILTRGDWDSILWLRARVDSPRLRDWIIQHRGRGLSPEQLRFWELALKIPHRQVNSWLAAPARRIWDQRAAR
jgi:hypothetical protein